MNRPSCTFVSFVVIFVIGFMFPLCFSRSFVSQGLDRIEARGTNGGHQPAQDTHQ